jgi:hypothetical protein
MCGIAGVYSTQYTNPEKDLFQRLLLLNAFRGMDSTGVVKIRNKPRLSCARIRAVLPSPEFIFTKKGSEFISEIDKVIGMIGHTRAATKGSVTAQNAHPFEFDNVIGVHNGTIKYSFEGSEKYDTDSEALYKLINDYGIEEALNKVAHADPAYALVFIDKRQGTLNFIKNSKRPLCFTFMYGRTTLAWSSTRDALEFGIKSGSTAANLSGWEPSDKADPFFTLKNHQLMSIKLGQPATTATLKTLDVKEAVTSYGYSGNYSGSSMAWIKGSDGQYRSKEAEAERLANLAKNSTFDTSGTVDDELDTVFGPRGDLNEDRRSGGSGDYAGFRENSPGDLSLLPWLPQPQQPESKAGSETPKSASKAANQKPEVKPPLNTHGTVPLSTAERDFKLSCGCFACGQVIRPDDAAEVARVKWWSRDFYACGDCYEGSDGDWVRMTVDDTWPDAIKTVN